MVWAYAAAWSAGFFVEPDDALGGVLAQPLNARTPARNRTLMRACYRTEYEALFLRRGRIGLSGVLLRGRIDVRPGPRAPGPDVRRDLHAVALVERAGAQHHGLRRLLALAVELRAAVAAEKAVQQAPAVGVRAEALRRALEQGERGARHDRVHGAAGAARLLAVGAVAGAQLGDRLAHGVADRSAKATTGQWLGH